MSVNGQYDDPPFGLGGDYASTSAPGTPVPGPEVSEGPLLARVPVTIPGASSQFGADTVAVMAGDTCSMSADAPVPSGGDPLTGLSLSQVTETGAGMGSGHTVHPNSMARRP